MRFHIFVVFILILSTSSDGCSNGRKMDIVFAVDAAEDVDAILPEAIHLNDEFEHTRFGLLKYKKSPNCENMIIHR